MICGCLLHAEGYKIRQQTTLRASSVPKTSGCTEGRRTMAEASPEGQGPRKDDVSIRLRMRGVGGTAGLLGKGLPEKGHELRYSRLCRN